MLNLDLVINDETLNCDQRQLTNGADRLSNEMGWCGRLARGDIAIVDE